MNLIEKQGNTELYYQGEIYGTIYAKYKGRTIRLVGATYAQSKTSDLESVTTKSAWKRVHTSP